MPDSIDPRPPDKVGRNLIKALTFVGAILGAGVIGLAKTVTLFGEELGWISNPPALGGAHWWILGGAVLGFLGSWVLVRTRRRP
jgi:hypothetical protein